MCGAIWRMNVYDTGFFWSFTYFTYECSWHRFQLKFFQLRSNLTFLFKFNIRLANGNQHHLCWKFLQFVLGLNFAWCWIKQWRHFHFLCSGFSDRRNFYFQFMILAYYHQHYQSQAPGELIIKAAKQVMTHLQIKISLPIHNDTCLVYLALLIVVYTRLLGKDGEEKVVAVGEGGRRRSNAAKNLRMLKRDSCCLPPMAWWPVTLGGVELTTVQTSYPQSGFVWPFFVLLTFWIILKSISYFW